MKTIPTLGPWKSEPYLPNSVEIVNDDGVHVAFCTEANAPLISASRELYTWSVLAHRLLLQSNCNDWEVINGLYAAIAKANGNALKAVTDHTTPAQQTVTPQSQ